MMAFAFKNVGWVMREFLRVTQPTITVKLWGRFGGRMSKMLISNEFRFVEGGFEYKNTLYLYKNIQHTGIYQRVIKTTYNVVGPTGKENETIVKFITKAGEEITLQETMNTRKLIGFTDDKIIEQIREIFTRVSNETFKSRVEFYESQLRKV